MLPKPLDLLRDQERSKQRYAESSVELRKNAQNIKYTARSMLVFLSVWEAGKLAFGAHVSGFGCKHAA